jgi:hypothetical protein
MNLVEEKIRKQLSNANKQKIGKLVKKTKKILKKPNWQNTQANRIKKPKLNVTLKHAEITTLKSINA